MGTQQTEGTMSTHQTWIPTNKWIAAQTTAVSALAISWVTAGAWTRPLTCAAIGVVAQAAAAYLVSNDVGSTGDSTQDAPESAVVGGLGASSTVRGAVA
jgi:hypothetical protein